LDQDAGFFLVRQYQNRRISLHSFAQMLDVDPAVIPLWEAAQQDAATDKLLHTDPAKRAAAELAELEDAIADCNARLAKPELGDRAFTNLTAQKTKLLEQRAKLLERYGLDKFIVDERDNKTRLIHEAMDDCFGELERVLRECKDAGVDFAELLIDRGPPEPAPGPRARPRPLDTGCSPPAEHSRT
jgi:hypothetical protein